MIRRRRRCGSCSGSFRSGRFGWWSARSGWGRTGKLSTLIQLVPHARYEFLLINDSDITVGPHYLER